jgi:hypothetical protein
MELSAVLLYLVQYNGIHANASHNKEKQITYSANLITEYEPIPIPPPLDHDKMREEADERMRVLREEAEERQHKHIMRQRDILHYIRDNSGKYSEAEVIDHFNRIGRSVASSTTSHLLELQKYRMIISDRNGRLHAIYAQSGQPVIGEQKTKA